MGSQVAGGLEIPKNPAKKRVKHVKPPPFWMVQSLILRGIIPHHLEVGVLSLLMPNSLVYPSKKGLVKLLEEKKLDHLNVP